MAMQGSPPHGDQLVTRLNWQEPGYNRWAFWHVRELLPTHRVSRGVGPVRALPPGEAGGPDVRSLPVTRIAAGEASVGDLLDDAFTDAVVVLQDGRLVHEWYAPAGGPDVTHLLMSVSKSVIGCVAGRLVADRRLDVARDVASYVPELAASGFAGATVRQLLDMTSGVAFVEDYSDPAADVRRLDQWAGWRPSTHGEEPLGVYRFLAGLGRDAPHGSAFRYRSSETDALGWVLERAAGMRMADLVSALLWGPMGAEHDAEFVCDGVGTALHDGGMTATARDLARLGQLLLDDGLVTWPDGRAEQVVPPEWLRDAWSVDAAGRRLFAASGAEQSFPGGWYRSQLWFRPGAYGDVLLALGIHGQMLHVSRRTRTVCVKLSTWPTAQDAALLLDTVRAFDEVGGALSGRAPLAELSRPDASRRTDRSGLA